MDKNVAHLVKNACYIQADVMKFPNPAGFGYSVGERLINSGACDGLTFPEMLEKVIPGAVEEAGKKLGYI